MKQLIHIAVLVTLLTTQLLAQSVMVQHLRCEYRQNPLGVQQTKPALSWHLTSTKRNVMQTAYQILVADSPDALKANKGTVWDSGKIVSDASIQVAYNGKPLIATAVYYWKVKVWDNQNQPSAWSENGFLAKWAS